MSDEIASVVQSLLWFHQFYLPTLTFPAEVVQSVSGLVAATAGAFAAWTANATVRASRADRKSAREDALEERRESARHVYFRTLIIDPGRNAISDYTENVLVLLGTAQKEINEAKNNAGFTEVEERVKKLVTDYLEIDLRLGRILNSGLDAWQDVVLKEDIVDQLGSLQDEMTALCEKLLTTGNVSEAEAIMRSKTSAMTRLIMNKDPILLATL